MSRLPSVLLAPFALLGALVLLVGLTSLAARTPDAVLDADRATAAQAEPTPTASASPEPAAAPAGQEGDETSTVVPGRGSLAAAGSAAEAATAPPVAVRIPGAGVDSGVEDLAIDRTGRLASPEAWQRTGWFADGTAPGDVGPAVIAGHVDSPTGPAVFARLGDLRPGDLVEVEREDGTVVEFRVDRSRVVGKEDFPTEEVYGPTPDAQLRLITCDGPYVRSSGGYQDNLVVWASAVSA